jgi:hypothetical protein
MAKTIWSRGLLLLNSYGRMVRCFSISGLPIYSVHHVNELLFGASFKSITTMRL